MKFSDSMLRQQSRKKPIYQIKIAKERIAILFGEAAKRARSDPDLAKRYVRLARRIGMRYNVRINEYKILFCRKCSRLFTTDRRRLVKGKLEITCSACGHVTKYMYKGQREKDLSGREQ